VTGPTPEHLRAMRRQLVKQHHPDHGGDVDRFVEVLAALESPPTLPTLPSASPTTTPDPSVSGARRRRGLVRTVQTHLPRRLPGAKRYATY